MSLRCAMLSTAAPMSLYFIETKRLPPKAPIRSKKSRHLLRGRPKSLDFLRGILSHWHHAFLLPAGRPWADRCFEVRAERLACATVRVQVVTAPDLRSSIFLLTAL